MIKLPESHGAAVHKGEVLGYTEAQLKQAVRDAYEDAAKVCDEQAEKVNSRWIPKECAIAIRALIKEISDDK